MEASEYSIEVDGIRILATGELIPHERVRRDAPDGLFHRCTYGGDRSRATIVRHDGPCLWAPEAGF